MLRYKISRGLFSKAVERGEGGGEGETATTRRNHKFHRADQRSSGGLQHRRLGPAGRRRRRMTARVVVVVIIVVVIARLAGVARAVEFFMGYEGAQIVEADVARTAVTRSALAGIQAFLRRWRVLAFLLHLPGDCER